MKEQHKNNFPKILKFKENLNKKIVNNSDKI